MKTTKQLENKGIHMAQAKVLTEQEVDRVLRYLESKHYASRNKAMFLLSMGCGVRIKELVSIRISDVLARDGSIRSEIFLKKDQTKGREGRTVYLSEKMRELIHNYLCERESPRVSWRPVGLS